MVWRIPFIFRAGEYAKANEVNENFQSVKNFVDSLEQETVDTSAEIIRMGQTKANINGDNQQRFSCSNPVSSFDAINLQTFNNLTKAYREVISGFVCSKASNTTINITSGSCWDSTSSHQIIADNPATLTVQNVSAETQYYIFVATTAESNAITYIYGDNPTNPTLPQTFVYFRQIGVFFTDANKDILQVGGAEDNLTGLAVTAQDLQANGYCRFSNGLTIQWGHTTSQSVTYPIPYRLFAIPVCIKMGWADTKDPDSGLGSYSLTGFNYTVKGAWSGMNWIAIGV